MSDDFTFDVFLSYSSDDGAQVREIALKLREAGLKVWIDHWEVDYGDSIFSAIERGLEESRVLVLFMTESSLGKDWVRLESQTFRFRDPVNSKGRFVPVRLGKVEVKGTLAQFKYIDWTEPDALEILIQRILRARPACEVAPAPEGGVAEAASQVSAEPERVSAGQPDPPLMTVIGAEHVQLDTRAKKILNTLWHKQVNRGYWPKRWLFWLGSNERAKYREAAEKLANAGLITYTPPRGVMGLTERGWEFCKANWKRLGNEQWWAHPINLRNLEAIVGADAKFYKYEAS